MSNSEPIASLACPLPHSTSSVIRLGHGSGGKMTSSLIENLFLPILGNETLSKLDDAAAVNINDSTIAITTDSYVVTPIFFPGGDIGSLSVHGTVNDLAMRGAKPLFMTAAFILEEGLSFDDLSLLTKSLQQACIDTGIKLVACDTKVVNKNAADQLFINTTGIGLIDKFPPPSAYQAQAGDCILLSGDIGRHGIAIMASREGLELETSVLSDSAPLHGIVAKMMASKHSIHCLRDITRGGLASVLNELALASNVGINIEEDKIPIHPEVRAVCEILGLDPFYVACEGRMVAIVPADAVDDLLSIMVQDPVASNSCLIGQITADHPNRVVVRSRVGGNRILDKLSGDQLPRIC